MRTSVVAVPNGVPLFHPLDEILLRYVNVLVFEGGGIQMVLAVAVALGLHHLHQRGKLTSWMAALPLVVGAGIGAWRLWRQRALFDDAYISFRYARNLLEGNGLVFNVGEYTEGYTNFLWTMLVTTFSFVTRAEIPLSAFILNILVYVSCVVVAFVVERHNAPSRPFPLAPTLVASQLIIAAYGTTGMETLFGALLVCIAVFQLRERPGIAGLLLSLAVLHRLDHAVFWCAGLVGVFTSTLKDHGPQGLVPRLGRYVAPIVLLVVYLGWKLWYYGDILPNTFYAKEGHGFRADQGLVYISTFMIGSHAWLLTVPLGAFILGRWREHPAVAAFFASALPVWTLYIMKVGGDFMYARFCIPLFPAAIVVASIEVWKNHRRGLMLAITAATFGGTMIIPSKGLHHWGQANENRVYPVEQLWPEVVMDHIEYRQGRFFDKVFRQRDIDVYLGTCCVGMLGYYSMLPMLDFHGLTDSQIAHKPIGKRGLAGHEKMARPSEIRARGVDIGRWHDRDPKRFRGVSRISFPGHGRRLRQKSISIVTWDQQLMSRIQREVPEVKFVDFPSWLDGYIEKMGRHPQNRVRQDLAWFREYYFDHTTDPDRLEKLTRYIDTGELPRGSIVYPLLDQPESDQPTKTP